MSDAAKLRKQLEKLIAEAAADSRIRNTAERILALKPRDVLALQCKAVCCIHAEKFGAALAVLDLIAPGEMTAADAFHRAYCYYRMQQYAEARHTLEQYSALTAHHTPSMHLRAQIHYHLEEYDAAATIYAALLQDTNSHDADTRLELLTNYTAALAGSDPVRALRLVQAASEASAADEESFDLFYNAAAAQLAMGEHGAALQTLRRAEAVCAALYPTSKVKRLSELCGGGESGAKVNEAGRAEKLALLACPLPGQPVTTERQFFDEVANIWLQMAFVHHALHEEAVALDILQLVLRLKPSSVVTSAIASINWVALQRREENFFEALHKLRATQQVKVARRLTARQKLAALYNMVLLYLHNGSLAQARKLLEQLVKDHPQSELTHTLRLALAVREGNKKRKTTNAVASQGGGEAASLVQDYLQQYERSLTTAQRQSGTLQLVTAQLALEQGDLAGAIAALSSAQLGPLQHNAVVVATLTAWRVQSQDIAGALQSIRAEVIARAKTSLPEARALLLWAVHYFASPSRELYSESATLLRDVRAAVPALRADKDVLALLVLCLSHVDLAAARAVMQDLAQQGGKAATGAAAPPPPPLGLEREEAVIEGPSRATLEALGFCRPRAAAGKEKEAAATALRRRRPRPMRRPPRSSEGGRPDPERWLPMSVRSYIKDLPPRRKRELKRLRALDQEQKRRLREKRKAEAAQGAMQANE